VRKIKAVSSGAKPLRDQPTEIGVVRLSPSAVVSEWVRAKF
jgi:hypothetical protein